MRPPRYFEVDPKDIKPGDVFCGYDEDTGNSSSHIMHMCEVNVQDDGTPLVYNKYPIKEKVLFFHRELTWKEQREWYQKSIDMTNSRNQLNLMGLHTDLYGIGDAVHEMWNGWIEVDWREQLATLIDEDFFIVGVADPAPINRIMRHPVAVVIEYKDGDRYWCHAEKDWIDDMREDSLEEYNKLMK